MFLSKKLFNSLLDSNGDYQKLKCSLTLSVLGQGLKLTFLNKKILDIIDRSSIKRPKSYRIC